MASRFRLPVPAEKLARLCREHHIRKLALFGSALRDDFRPESDLDILVEFEPGKVPGLRFFAIQEELARIFGRPVDLNTAEDLSIYYRDKVLAEAEPLCLAA